MSQKLKRALITGITGQDGSYLSEFLLEKNYEGFGILTNDKESVFLGIGLGLIFGSSVGFLITSDIGVTIEAILEDDVTTHLIPVMGSFWRIVFFSTLSQAIIATIGILLGVPKGLDIYELKEANIISISFISSLLAYAIVYPPLSLEIPSAT